MNSMDAFKEGEAEMLRSVLARLERLIEEHQAVVPIRKVQLLRKELARSISGIDNERVLKQ